MKKKIITFLGLCTTLTGSCFANLGVDVYYEPAPAYYEPAPVPVYYEPAPTYYAPPVTYYNTYRLIEHRSIGRLWADDKMLELDDLSRWSIPAGQEHLTCRWEVGDTIVFLPNPTKGKFKFILYNNTRHNQVVANTSESPNVAGEEAFTIASIDSYWNRITLQTKSGERRIFSVPSHDWRIGDCISVGLATLDPDCCTPKRYYLYNWQEQKGITAYTRSH